MKIFLTKGYHSPQIPDLLRKTWEENHLSIFLPALLSDFSFVSHLPEGEIEFLGNWTESEKEALLLQTRHNQKFPSPPVLGLFSSGSSGGKSKLILYSKKNIEFALNGVMNFFDKNEITHLFCYPHPFHTFGLLLGYMQAVLQNWQITPLTGKYSSHFHHQWLESVTPTTLTLGTPTHLKDLMHYLTSQGVSPKASYSCIVGGAPVTPQLWQNLKDVLNIQKPSVGYGATEASPALTHLPPGQKPTSPGDIGYALKGIELKILPAEGFEFKGPNVCLAIIQGDQVQFPETILLRDDLQKNSDGSYTFLGRTDFTLNRGGEKFKLEEIENFLFEKVKMQVTALAVPDKRLGFDLGLLIDSSDSQPLISREQLLHILHDQYHILFNGGLFLRTPHFPIGDTGKRDRNKSYQMWRELFETSQAIYGAP